MDIAIMLSIKQGERDLHANQVSFVASQQSHIIFFVSLSVFLRNDGVSNSKIGKILGGMKRSGYPYYVDMRKVVNGNWDYMYFIEEDNSASDILGKEYVRRNEFPTILAFVSTRSGKIIYLEEEPLMVEGQFKNSVRVHKKFEDKYIRFHRDSSQFRVYDGGGYFYLVQRDDTTIQ